jgi:hypothetical protein
MDEDQPRPGDLIGAPFAGPLGWFVTLLQALAGEPSRVSHIEVVVSATQTVSAQHPRARIGSLAETMKRRPLAIIRVPEWAEDRRQLIVEAALGMVGARYQWLAYAWIGLSKIGIRPAWLKRALETEGALICSALGDRAWYHGGIHMVRDGRTLFGAITPGRIARIGHVHWWDSGPYPDKGDDS